jgi:DNA-binding MarR family transcriptional regulator
MKNHHMEEATEERDHIDRFLEEHLEELEGITDAGGLEVEAIVDRIGSIHRRLKQAMEETLEQFDLSFGEWQLLTTLRWAGEPHRQSPGDLAKKLELSSGAMTNRLDRLEEAGYVRRLPDPRDRRGVQVELTDEGARIWRRSVVAQAEKEAIIAAALGQEEMEQLNRLLRRVLLQLERRGRKGEG